MLSWSKECVLNNTPNIGNPQVLEKLQSSYLEGLPEALAIEPKDNKDLVVATL